MWLLRQRKLPAHRKVAKSEKGLDVKKNTSTRTSDTMKNRRTYAGN